MDWKKFFVRFLRNVIIFTALCTLLLGGFGYLLSGKEGLINMAYWGIALGLLGGFSSGIGILFEAKFWGEGNYPILPEWNWFIKKSEDEKSDK